MSNINVVQHLASYEKAFNGQNTYDLKFSSECLFAKQQVVRNDLTLKTAANNQDSLRAAILNVAAIGISLNPATSHAYLVPRQGAICLDISYRGLVKLATDAGAIEWAKAVLVYKGDDFKWRGPCELPHHEVDDIFNGNRINPADPLQNLDGGYCIAKMKEGYMVDLMSAGEILEIRNSSKAQNGPWKGKWSGEMAKKSLIKRAYKSWPQSGGLKRLEDAIYELNQHEGLEEETRSIAEYIKHSPEQEGMMHDLLAGDEITFFLWFSALDDNIQTSLYNSFAKGEKSKGKAIISGKIKAGVAMFKQYVAALEEACAAEDLPGATEIIEELPEGQRHAVIDAVPVELKRFAMNAVEFLAVSE